MIIIRGQCSVQLFNIHMRPNRRPLRHGLRCKITVVVCLWEENATQSINALDEETCFGCMKTVYCLTDPIVFWLHCNAQFHLWRQMWAHIILRSSEML